MKRLQSAKNKAKMTKLRMMGNKGQRPTNDDDEGAEEACEEKKALDKYIADFSAEADLVRGLFNLVNALLEQNISLSIVLIAYPNLDKMLVKGMIESENFNLRKIIFTRMSLFIIQNSSEEAMQNENRLALFNRMLSILLF